ncbi:hypothetical protein ABQJ54_07685 [Rhodanobacter sp. Si-c]|uniref:Uncharacterized protein n=1 Tax=Rhodanobacter lycopersici TaxID=3162487 RepID=A0ABV3QCR9_9GAMM
MSTTAMTLAGTSGRQMLGELLLAPFPGNILSNTPTSLIAIRFVLNRGDGGPLPSRRDFSPAEIVDIRQCLDFKLDVDPGNIKSNWEARILEVTFVYDGITPIRGEDFGYRLSARKAYLQGYPAPILRFLLDHPVNPALLCRVLAGSRFSLTTSSLSEAGETPYYAEDHNGYSSVLAPTEVAEWQVLLEHHHAFCGRTFTFPDGLPENGCRFKATDFALPPFAS